MIDFSRRPKILDYKDDDPRLFVDLDPDEFVKELKGMDSNHFDPLPCNIMCVLQFAYLGNNITPVNDWYCLAGGHGRKLTEIKQALAQRRTFTG